MKLTIKNFRRICGLYTQHDLIILEAEEFDNEYIFRCRKADSKMIYPVRLSRNGCIDGDGDTIWSFIHKGYNTQFVTRDWFSKTSNAVSAINEEFERNI